MKFIVELIILSIVSFCYSQDKPVLMVGLVSDTQYANIPSRGDRQYQESLWKLREAVDTFKHYNVDFIQSLGDIIEEDWSSLDSILPIYKGLDVCHALGNHAFSIDEDSMPNLLEALSMPYYYYSYSHSGWRFIVLDATDCSYLSSTLHDYNVRQVDSFYNKRIGLNKNIGAIGGEQQYWVEKELDIAEASNQNVIIFSHAPVFPIGSRYNIWNDLEVVDIIERSPNVVAYINGHNHNGGFFYNNGINYITLRGMVNTMNNSYAILEVYDTHLIIRGYGNQISIIISDITKKKL